MNLCSLDMQGLLALNKRFELESFVEEEKIDVILIQETFLLDTTCQSEAGFRGFREFLAVRKGRGNGGVSLYVKKGFPVTLNKIFSKRYVKIQVTGTKNYETIYINVYYAPISMFTVHH